MTLRLFEKEGEILGENEAEAWEWHDWTVIEIIDDWTVVVSCRHKVIIARD